MVPDEGILLLGAEGQVGSEILQRVSLPPEWAPRLSALDITEASAVRDYMRHIQPRVVINCAAFTAVDAAESQFEAARAVNALAVEVIARECMRLGARLLHVSTDYVFAGGAEFPSSSDLRLMAKPVSPTALPSPLNVYGRTKREGEVLCGICSDATVVRTSSVHGRYGANFVATMLRLFEERDEVRVVNDQYMSPTWAGWLAAVLLQLSARPGRLPRVVHASGLGTTTWFDFAGEILTLVRPRLAGRDVRVVPIASSEYKVAATRPRFSVLDCSALSEELGIALMPWREGLRQHLLSLGLIDQ